MKMFQISPVRVRVIARSNIRNLPGPTLAGNVQCSNRALQADSAS
jgi:hypothetical protein